VRAFHIAYDGRPYRGFQRQPDVPTVEDALVDALADLGIADGDPPPGYSAAGRTDAGVSALAQTVAFECPDWCSPGALNGELPPAIRAWATADVPEEFHATHDATRREYTYHLYAPAADRDDGEADPPAVDVAGRDPFRAVRASVPPVDDDRVRAALDRLAGEHDFHNLSRDDQGTVRDLSLDAHRDGDVLVLGVAAGGFARELVRRLVTLVRAVGTGERGLDFVDRVLGSDPLDGKAGIGPAAPEPLVLTAVDYPAVSFDADPDAVAAVRSAFARRARGALGVARAAGTIASGVDGASPDGVDDASQ